MSDSFVLNQGTDLPKDASAALAAGKGDLFVFVGVEKTAGTRLDLNLYSEQNPSEQREWIGRSVP